jgi:hypothetical protein
VLKYDAFVSYAIDALLALRLESALARFAKPLLRDDTRLTATPALWTSIEEALYESGAFIVMASPWVARELDHWLADRSPECLVMTDCRPPVGR